jgi:hypothetical protein
MVTCLGVTLLARCRDPRGLGEQLGFTRPAHREFKDKGLAGTWFYARCLYDEPLAFECGEGRIQLVKVATTLANHMSTYPTKWIFDGQTVSGLLGPVRVQFSAPVIMQASAADLREAP